MIREEIRTVYQKCLKRVLDFLFSLCGLVVLMPAFLMLIVLIKLDSRGPVFFKQKRVGVHKIYFNILKFRTMRVDTPKDMPTHMLKSPESYITRVGRFLRKTSMDELPQIINILKGDMSIIGPRPALWNQYDLIAERDKYGANDVMPGLTGWAQINGRDELEIPVKAKLDGEYVERLSFRFDCICFVETITAVMRHDGVMEGGTGLMYKQYKDISVAVPSEQKRIAIGSMSAAVSIVISSIIIKYVKKKNGFAQTIIKKNHLKLKWLIGIIMVGGASYIAHFNAKEKSVLRDDFANYGIDKDSKKKSDEDLRINEKKQSAPKKVLITGLNSYIGTSVEKWLKNSTDKYEIKTLDMTNEKWKKNDFSKYDVVYHVAGIAHADTGIVTEEQKQLYYDVNTALAVAAAEKAKEAGVKQFIFMSSMIVYSGCKEKIITIDTEPKPLNFYGNSKWQADQRIRKLADEKFKVVVVRPPMIYGKGSKGNYPELAKLAVHMPIFPIVKNKRSLLYIDNLCQFIKLMIDDEAEGVFFPQNSEYASTSDIAQIIAGVKGHRILMIPFMNLLVKLMSKVPGRMGNLAAKAFGDLSYEMSMSEYKKEYRINSLRESIKLTEA